MKTKHSLILSLLLTFAILNTIYLFSSLNIAQSDLELITITRVIDGDTLELSDQRIVRLVNINSPEKSSALHEESKKYLENLVEKELFMENLGKEKYGRTLARIYQDNNYINLDLVKYGLASKFLVDNKELKEFSRAEKEAIENGIGIWNHSVFYGCVSSNLDKDKERVQLSSSCGAIDITGWTLKDESRKEYKFRISEFNTIILFSGQGMNSKEEIYWNQKTNVWNSDRDTLYLFDEENRIVLAESYGY